VVHYDYLPGQTVNKKYYLLLLLFFFKYYSSKKTRIMGNNWKGTIRTVSRIGKNVGRSVFYGDGIL